MKVPPSRPGQSCSSRGSRCRSMPGGLYSKHLATDNTSRIGVDAASPAFPQRASPSRGQTPRTCPAHSIGSFQSRASAAAGETSRVDAAPIVVVRLVARRGREAVASQSSCVRRQGPTDVPEGRDASGGAERVAQVTCSDGAATGGKIGVRKLRASPTARRCSSAAEQGSHKPRVGGSIPPTATTLTRPVPDATVAVRDASASDAAYSRKARAASSTWARRARLNGLAT